MDNESIQRHAKTLLEHIKENYPAAYDTVHSYACDSDEDKLSALRNLGTSRDWPQELALIVAEYFHAQELNELAKYHTMAVCRRIFDLEGM